MDVSSRRRTTDCPGGFAELGVLGRRILRAAAMATAVAVEEASLRGSERCQPGSDLLVSPGEADLTEARQPLSRGSVAKGY